MAEQLRDEINRLNVRINRMIMQGKERAADRLEQKVEYLEELVMKLS